MADYELEDEYCSGCDLVINEGNVITFDDKVWHVKCFRCSNCRSRFQTNSNILILNQNPICEACSYTCEVCKKQIADQAVLLGDKSIQAFHRACFKCSTCQKSLEPTQYTLTKEGLQCSNCCLRNDASNDKATDTPQQTVADYSNVHSSHANGQINQSELDPNITITSSLHRSRPHFKPPTRSSSITKRPTRSHSLRSPNGQKVKLKKRQSMMPSRSFSERYLEERGPPTLPPLPFLEESVSEENLGQIIRGVRDAHLNNDDTVKTACVEGSSEASVVSEEEKHSGNGRISPQIETVVNDVESISPDISSELISLKALNIQLIEQLEQLRKELLKECALRQDLEKKYQILETERDLLSHSHEECTNQKKENVNMYRILSDNIEHLSIQKEEMETVIYELQVQKEKLYSDIDTLLRKKQIEFNSLSTSNEKVCDPYTIVSNDCLDSIKVPDPLATITSPLVMRPLPPSLNYAAKKSNNEKLSRRSAVVNQHNTSDNSNLNLAISYEDTGLSPVNGAECRPVNDTLDIPISIKPDAKKESKKFKWMGGNSSKAKGKHGNVGEKECDLDNTQISTNNRLKYKKSNISSPINNKAHTFTMYTFIRPLKCDHCREKMWGLQNKEMKCQLCGFRSHVKCSNLVMLDCPGHVQTEAEPSGVINMFGNELEDQLILEGRAIPLIVELCIDAVEKRGIMLEGIYRKSGPTSQMREIQSALARASNGEGPSPDLEDPDEFTDITAVTSILKQYFRELPVPLLTYDSYKDFMDALYTDVEEERLTLFKYTLSLLPKAYYDTLKYLVMHLIRIQQYESVNLMSIKNLAVVFGPTLMRNPDPSQEFYDTAGKNAVVEYLLCCAEDLFEEECSQPPATEYDYFSQIPNHDQSLDNPIPNMV
ncbi:Rho-type gtpase-activating protein [Basidiobolus ranarum]|uniref:Rho-type gtpase-activating protein n=1 Tax=Basidiobolus ranarum TaxID=34480 RepID=A0ABR2WQ45_9FUNG